MKIFVPLRKRNLSLKEIDNRWSEMKMETPFSNRSSFAFCAQADTGYLHGGYNYDEGILGDMHIARFTDQQDRRWRQIEQKGKDQPGQLRNHTMNSYTYYLICVGGQKSTLENNGDVFKFNLKTKTWSKVEVVSSMGLSAYDLLSRDSHCSFINGNNLYIFGGYLLKVGRYSNQILKLDLTKLQEQNKMTLTIVSNEIKPSPRSNMACCTLPESVYIFGGTNSEQFFKDFWKFDCIKQKWEIIERNSHEHGGYWPEERKGAVLTLHKESGNLILFGGMKEITKQLNDVSIYLVSQKHWVKVHSNTNNLYDPSPTIKKQIQDSPTIIESKRKRNNKNKTSEFRLGIKSTNCDETNKTTFIEPESFKRTSKNFRKGCRTEMTMHATEKNIGSTVKLERRMSVVQQKKYRQFLVRKRKLLSEISVGFTRNKERRLSPTSESLNYSIHQIGEQKQFRSETNPQFHIPKVIFDDKKSMVIGKKPCARDGHSAFVFQESMYIIGGDRHMVSFNDTHVFRMDKAIESISYYES